MKLVTLWSVLILAALPALAQPSNLEINTETPEGQLLQQIGEQEDPSQKVVLLEQFVKQYPNHEAIKWVLGQLPPAYAQLKQPQKSLAACEKMIEKDPTNAAGAHGCLKTAEAQKDPDLIRKWALSTSDASKKAVAAPKPEFEYEDEEEEWKEAIDFATQVGTYAEYSLYATALQTTDPAKKLDLIKALRQANPESQYLPQVVSQAFLTCRQAGQMDGAVAIVEDALANNQATDAMLLGVADYYFNQKKDAAKTLEYCDKLITMLESGAAPEGMSPADWEKKKNLSVGMANWMIGLTYSNQKKYVSADKALRKALPNLKENPELLAGALFHLGVANFQLGNKSGNEKRILDGFNFSKQSAAMKSPFQAQAKKNVAAIQTQYRIK